LNKFKFIHTILIHEQ